MIPGYHPSLVDPDANGIPCSIFRVPSSIQCGRTSVKSTTPAADDGRIIGTRVGGDCSAPRSTDAAPSGSKRAEGATSTSRVLAVLLDSPRSERWIMRRTGLAQSTVNAAVRRLVDDGHALRVPSKRQGDPARYRVIPPLPCGCPPGKDCERCKFP